MSVGDRSASGIGEGMTMGSEAAAGTSGPGQTDIHPALVIRPARDSDAENVKQIVLAAYTKYVARLDREPAPMSTNYPESIHQGVVWVAEKEPHGSVGVVVMKLASDHLFIENLAVDPRYQHLGVGSRLLRFAEAAAQKEGLPELRLYTNVLMTENHGYYQRRGFTQTHCTSTHGFRRIHFRKPVARRA